MRYFILVAMALFTVGCASTGGSGSVTQPEDAVNVTGEVYKIGEGDALSISVWRNPELTVAVPVGMVASPLAPNFSFILFHVLGSCSLTCSK